MIRETQPQATTEGSAALPILYASSMGATIICLCGGVMSTRDHDDPGIGGAWELDCKTCSAHWSIGTVRGHYYKVRSGEWVMSGEVGTYRGATVIRDGRREK